jgi:hypothetical protein
MIKHEIKVEYSDSAILSDLIKKAYFDDNQMGKIIKKDDFLKIEDSDDVNHTIFKNLDGATIKIWNRDIIDGFMRFIVDEKYGDIRLYPISIYCICENEKYCFY